MNRKIAIVLVIVGILCIISGVVIGMTSKKEKVELNEEVGTNGTYSSLKEHEFITCTDDITINGNSAVCNHEDIIYKMYTGIYDNSFIVDDGIIVSTYKKATLKSSYVTSGELVITLYDKEGNIKWSVPYDNPYNNLTIKKSYLTAINKINDMYYAMIGVDYDNETSYEHIVKYDLNGNLVKDTVIKPEIDYNYLGLTFLEEYEGNYYYNNPSRYPSVVYISNDEYKTIFSDEDTFPKYLTMNKEYIYGVEDNNEEGYQINLIKYDLNGEVVKEQIVLKDAIAQEGFVVTDNYIFVTYYQTELDEFRIAKFNKDFELINDNIDYKKDIEANVSRQGIYLKDKLYFVFSDEEDYYVKVVSDEEEMLNLYKTHEGDTISINYFLKTFGYLDDKFVQVYTSKDYFEGNNEIILAFNK